MVVGIVKKLEEIFFFGDLVLLFINKKLESFKVIQYVWNEVYCFVIIFYWDKCLQYFIKSGLIEIFGIGEKIVIKLFSYFGLMKKVKVVCVFEIVVVINFGVV